MEQGFILFPPSSFKSALGSKCKITAKIRYRVIKSSKTLCFTKINCTFALAILILKK